MNYQEFYNLVADMRRKQKEYFKHRTLGALEDSKEAERKVDAALREYDPQQPSMFADER